MTKERPILFSGEMVKAILDGRKTQTRRILKPQPKGVVVSKPNFDGLFSEANDPVTRYFACHHGQPGDKLWVRETRADTCAEGVSKIPWYRADYLGHGEIDPPPGGIKWKPSIFMPRWASRITLEIVSVRVEKVQEIRCEDALAEGVSLEGELFPNVDSAWKAHKRFRFLWDSINAKRGYGWEKNPWVWAIEFKKL